MKAAVLSTLVLTLAAFSSGCVVVGDGYTHEPTNPSDPGTGGPSMHTVTDYGFSATASSEGLQGSLDYSALQAVGAPDVDVCGDAPRAWSPATSNPMPGIAPDGNTIDDYLDVAFPEYLYVRQVKIYETNAPGAIVAVDLIASDGSATPLTIFENYVGDGPAPCPSAFVITLDGGSYAQYDRVAIYVDENLIGDFNQDGSYQDDWPEIDAVEVTGDVWY